MDNNRENNPDVNRTLQKAARLNAELDALLSEHQTGEGSKSTDGGSNGMHTSGSRYADKQHSAAASASGMKSRSENLAENSRITTEGISVLSQRAVDEKAGKRRRRHRGLRILAGILCVLILLAGLAAGGIWYLREQGRKELLIDRPETTITAPEGVQISTDGSYVSFEGKKYKKNENVVSILVMGVDRDEEEIAASDTLTVGEQGQADTILVGALDTQTGALNIINISRDSMVDVDMYNVSGEYAGVGNMQICLAYAYGDGAYTSCQNVSKSVSRLLYGIPMDIYASIELPAVNVLNDAVGGVTVEVLEDLSRNDPGLTKGSVVTLNGDQARIYIRSRDSETLDSNNARMARQKQYLTAFLQKVSRQVRSNLSTILTLYQAAQTYMTTNIDLSRTAYLASVAFTRDITADTIRTVPGDVVEGEEYAEYHVDDEALYKIILDAFYTETDEGGENIPMTEAEGRESFGTDQTEDIEQNTADIVEPEASESHAVAETEGMITVDPVILH